MNFEDSVCPEYSARFRNRRRRTFIKCRRSWRMTRRISSATKFCTAITCCRPFNWTRRPPRLRRHRLMSKRPHAAVQTAALNLGYTKIYAPIGGRIGEPQVKVGSLVTLDTTLLDTIYSINSYLCGFQRYRKYLYQLRRRGAEKWSPAGPVEPSSPPISSS
jgi:hypothetical protein